MTEIERDWGLTQPAHRMTERISMEFVSEPVELVGVGPDDSDKVYEVLSNITMVYAPNVALQQIEERSESGRIQVILHTLTEPDAESVKQAFADADHPARGGKSA